MRHLDDTFLGGNQRCRATGGGDAIFEVELSAGETVEANVLPSPGASASVFVLNSCFVANPLPTHVCLDGSRSFTGDEVSTTYTASTNETVYLVVDSDLSWVTDERPWRVDIDVR